MEFCQSEKVVTLNCVKMFNTDSHWIFVLIFSISVCIGLGVCVGVGHCERTVSHLEAGALITIFWGVTSTLGFKTRMDLSACETRRLICLFTARTRSLQRLCFYTCLSFCPGGGGVCLSACWDTYWNAYFSLYSNVIIRSRGKVIFSEACVENSVHRGGCPPNCMLGYPSPPPDQRQTPPGSRHPHYAVHARRYGQQAGGTHPTGIHTCLYIQTLLSRRRLHEQIESDAGGTGAAAL